MFHLDTDTDTNSNLKTEVEFRFTELEFNQIHNCIGWWTAKCQS